MKELLQAYNFKSLQVALQIYDLIIGDGYTIEDLRDYIAQQRTKATPHLITTAVPKDMLCPECKEQVLYFYRVNHHPRAMVGGDYTIQETCPNCGYDNFK